MKIRISPEARAAAEQLAEAYMMTVKSVATRTAVASLMTETNWSHGVSERAKMAIIKRSLYDVKDPKEAAMAARDLVNKLINGGEIEGTPVVEKKKVAKSLDRVRLPKEGERIKEKKSKKTVVEDEAPLRVKKCKECNGWLRLRKATGEVIPQKSWGKYIDLDNVKVCECEEEV
jgi:hypothetical protein